MVKKKSKKLGMIIGLFFVLVILIGGFFILKNGEKEEEIVGPGPYDDFAQCLDDSGLKMYGSVTCSVCARQKTLFGNSFRLIDEIECNPYERGNQAAFCVEKGIESTPTWTIEVDGVEKARMVGYQTFETLSTATGCSI